MHERYHEQLLDTAKRSIAFGITEHRPLPLDQSELDPVLQEKRASFVTLHLDGNLRGCIGTLEAYQPLGIDVAQNAFNAAFKDSRFAPVNNEEFLRLHYHISILTPTSPIHFSSEEDLLSQLRPNIDGLILQEGMNRGTFLPAVWEQLPNKKSFLNQLKLKAGLPQHYWSNTIKVERYTVDSFGAP